MEEAEIMELYELSYSDLILLSSSSSSSLSCSPDEGERLEMMTRSIMETLGPTGPGLLSITGVPDASVLRRKLLPLARKLALLDPEARKRVLKEHSLGSDVPLKNPDRSVSSFAMQLKYADSHEFPNGKSARRLDGFFNTDQGCLRVDGVRDTQEDEFKDLGAVFKELGFCMMDLGLFIARICDKAIGGHELEQSLLESCAAKGRLIHYHSAQDTLILKEAGKKKGSAKRTITKRGHQEYLVRNEQTPSEGYKLDSNSSEVRSHGIYSDLWQQWHYDYGIFTVLTDPMFLAQSSCLSSTMSDNELLITSSTECDWPRDHSYLQIYHASKNKLLMVKSSPGSFIIQVGESADILSKGKLCSTLHCVRRPTKMENISRETFVVFLQPAWSKTFSISDYPMEHCNLGTQYSGVSCEGNHLEELELNELAQEIKKIVPPLLSRLKDGMTFAEFSRETTKKYYGSSGLQSNNKSVL